MCSSTKDCPIRDLTYVASLLPWGVKLVLCDDKSTVSPCISRSSLRAYTMLWITKHTLPHWAHDVVAKFNKWHWCWFNVASTSFFKWIWMNIQIHTIIISWNSTFGMTKMKWNGWGVRPSLYTWNEWMTLLSRHRNEIRSSTLQMVHRLRRWYNNKQGLDQNYPACNVGYSQAEPFRIICKTISDTEKYKLMELHSKLTLLHFS